MGNVEESVEKWKRKAGIFFLFSLLWNHWNLFWGLTRWKFLPGKRLNHTGKKSGKWLPPPRNIFPVTPLRVHMHPLDISNICLLGSPRLISLIAIFSRMSQQGGLSKKKKELTSNKFTVLRFLFVCLFFERPDFHLQNKRSSRVIECRLAKNIPPSHYHV